MIDKLALHAEALIFAAEKPISMEDIISTLEETLEIILDPNDVIAAVNLVKEKFDFRWFFFFFQRCLPSYHNPSFKTNHDQKTF